MSNLQEAIYQTRLKLELLEQKEKLEAEEKRLDSEVHRLKIIAHNEQADVENLSVPGIRGLLLAMTGKKQERLEKEQAEARHAKQNYETAAAKQESVLCKLNQCAEELAALGNCEETLRQLVSLSEHSELTMLTQCGIGLCDIQQQIHELMGALTKVLQLGAIRNGTQSTSALAGTDDKLRSAERSAQEMLVQMKTGLKIFETNLSAYGLELNTDTLQKINDDHLTDLYTYALITSRVENFKVALRQLGFQLDAIKPRLEQLTLEQQKKHLRTLLDAARCK